MGPLALNNEFLLAMERSFSVGVPDEGNTIKLYRVKLAGADNIAGLDAIGRPLAPYLSTAYSCRGPQAR